MRKLLLSSLIALAATGCAAKSAVTTPTQDTLASQAPAARPEAAPRPAPGAADEDAGALSASPIHYALDSATLLPESRQELETLAQAMRQRPGTRVTISGHTCELGTSEYNLALGQQRASVARDYLVRLGVEPTRIEVITYGEESPAQPGGDEEAYRKNRRSEFSINLASSGGGQES